MASGATHVVRVSAFDKNLDQIIADAMQHEGFALVEILELCTAYFSPKNKFRKKELENRLEELGGGGVLQNVSKPEYSAVARRHWPEKPKNFAVKGTAQKFEHKLPKNEYDLLLAGSAGMKVISAASNLGQASLYCGLWTSQKDDYPVTVQSGHSTSMLKFSQSRINYTGVNSPDGAIVISENGLNEVRHELEEMSPDGLVIADSKLEIKTPARLLKVDFAAAKLSKFNIIGTAVALFLLESQIMPIEALIEVINSIPKEKIREENFKAIEAAQKLYQEFEKANG